MTEHSASPRLRGEARFVVADFQDVLRRVSADCPLVGGQAVAWWAARYGIKPLEAGQERIVASRDIDFWGSREDLLRLARQLHRRAVLPHAYEMTVWVGAVPLSIQGQPTVAEFLHTIPGLDTNNPDQACVGQELVIGGVRKRLQILTPVSLVLAKLHALRHFDQTERQDEFHLRVCLEASVRFLEETVAAGEVRLLLWNVKRLINGRQLKAVRKLEQQYGFNLLQAVPLTRLRREAKDPRQSAENRDRLARFLTEYWPRMSRP